MAAQAKAQCNGNEMALAWRSNGSNGWRISNGYQCQSKENNEMAA